MTIEDVLVVDTGAAVTFDEDAVGGNGVVNTAEAAAGTVLTGTTQAGSTVTVIMGTHSYTAVVTGTTWSVAVPIGDLVGGEYEQAVTVNAVDIYGNSATTSGSFTVDTQTHVTLAAASVGGKGTVNAAEHTAGITVTGTARAGASVVVTMGGVSRTVIATAGGTWSVGYSASEVTPGTYNATVTAVATDQAGNTATASGTVHIDTEMFVTVNTAGIEADGIVNFIEPSDGITLSGTAEAESAVVVSMNGFSHIVTSAANGTWSANFAAGEIPSGEVNAPVSVTATDEAGNSTTATDTVHTDTEVVSFTLTEPIADDDIVNKAEATAGVMVSGTAGAGSTVVVVLGGVSKTFAANGLGQWSATFAASSSQSAAYTANLTATATAGNVSVITNTVQVDGHLDRFAVHCVVPCACGPYRRQFRVGPVHRRGALVECQGIV